LVILASMINSSGARNGIIYADSAEPKKYWVKTIWFSVQLSR
jgi:hypothetical protein